VDKPILLVGTMRSGTTLLRLILDSHERLALADESGFLRAVAAARTIPDQHDGPGWYRRYGVTDEDMNARLRAFYDGVFADWARGKGAVRWGDKTPFHINHLPVAAEVFPDAQIVGIVRHPGAVVASQLRRGIPFSDALRHWRNQNGRLLRAAGRQDLRRRLVVLRYEDLVADPEPVLRALLRFLGEPWSPDLLRHHEVQRERGAPRLAEGGTRTGDAIDPARNARWLEELSAAQRRELAEVTAPLRQVFGYRETDAAPLPDGRRLLRAPELRRRRRAVGPAAVARGPLPGASAAEPGALAHLVRVLRTDPGYALRRLPVVLRARRYRGADPDA